MSKRKYPENRNPLVRLLSRRAYRNRNKDRINAEKREKWAARKTTTAERLDEIEANQGLSDKARRILNVLRRKVG